MMITDTVMSASIHGVLLCCTLQLGFCTVYYLYVARNLGGVIGLTTFEAIAAQVRLHCV
jgi:hypothetical protein